MYLVTCQLNILNLDLLSPSSNNYKMTIKNRVCISNFIFPVWTQNLFGVLEES